MQRFDAAIAASNKRSDRVLRVLVTLATISGLIVVWWLYSASLNSAILLPSPAAVAQRLVELLFAPDAPYHLVNESVASLKRILIGWGTGVVLGVLVGMLMASNRWVQQAIDPLIELFRPIPPLAFAPLLVIWFGIGELPKDLILFLTAFPIMAISTVAAILHINENWKAVAQSLGASRGHVLRKVVLPGALPGILVGARLASGLAWSTLIAAEIIASSSGLGWMILQAGRYLDTETIFVGIVTIGTLAYLMDRLLRLIERQLVPWRGKV